MAAIVRLLLRGIRLFQEYEDPRTAHLPGALSPIPALSVIGAYLYFVNVWGPRYMQKRERFNLDRVMVVYNIVQVVWCAYLVKECWRLGWGWGARYSYLCEPLDMSVNEHTIQVGFGVYLYFILKIVDLLDTVFMVLRKNFRQITFLHVYHHAGMVIATWAGVKFAPGGHHTSLGFHNCIVHCVMYGYYLASLLNPRLKNAWWKKYITLLQIVQFGVNAIHFSLPFLQPSCRVNRLIVGALFVQNIFMFLMFTDFYWKAYVKKPQEKRIGSSKKD